MQKILAITSIAIVAAVLGLSVATPVLAGGVQKVTICHIPPGNPGNPQTITVGFDAVLPHVALHGDYVGSCTEDPVELQCKSDCLTKQTHACEIGDDECIDKLIEQIIQCSMSCEG